MVPPVMQQQYPGYAIFDKEAKLGESLMNLEKWQESVGKILLQFATAGPFVVQINGHRWLQVIAISPQRSEIVVVERATLAENSATRSRIMDNMIQFLQHLEIDIDNVEFVMDAISNAKLSNVGTLKHPIYSTGSKHLKKRLLQCFEIYDIVDKTTRMPQFLADAYKFIADRCRVITSADFTKRCKSKTIYTKHQLSQCDLAAIGGDFSEIISEAQMQQLFPDPQRCAGMKTLYENALNCIQLIEALDSDNKAEFIRFSKLFLELVNTDNNQCQDKPSGHQVPDLLEAADSIKCLVKLAETESWFSLAFFNIAVDYEVRSIAFDADVLTKGKKLPATVLQASYEPVAFDTPLTVLAVLLNSDKETIAKAVKHCVMQS